MFKALQCFFATGLYVWSLIFMGLSFDDSTANVLTKDEDMPRHALSQSQKTSWFDTEGNISACGNKILKLMENAPNHGILRTPYVDAIQYKNAYNLSPLDVHKANALLDAKIVAFLNDMEGSAIRTIYAEKSPALSKPLNMHNVLDQVKSDCDAVIKYLVPNSPMYAGLQKVLQRYAVLAQSLSKQSDPAVNLVRVLKKNVDAPQDVQKVRQYLKFYGYLSERDTTNSAFDANLEEAVKRFQSDHTEDADGIIGARAQKLFAMTLIDRINKVRLNMYRIRALNQPLPQRHILVNVAGYEIDCIDGDRVELEMPAIVGMPNNKTPQFQAPMSHIMINPTWTVPPGMKARNPGKYTLDTYPPGPSNPLGKVKFILKNPYIIYLHDTNHPELFKQAKRAKSSGCVRVAEPKKLLQWVASHTQSKQFEDMQQIDRVMNTGRTHTYTVDHPLSVYFLYLSVWLGNDGRVHFSDDPYGYDKKDLPKIPPLTLKTV